MFKRVLYILFIVTLIDIIMVSCQKHGPRQHCTTTLTDIKVEHYYLKAGDIYGHSIEQHNGQTQQQPPISIADYALKISLQDSVLTCEKLASLYKPLSMQYAYAFDPAISAHTNDRITSINIIAADDGISYLEGDTITNLFTMSAYLLDHRHDNLNPSQFVNDINNLLLEARKNRLHAGDYLPKIFMRINDPLMANMPLKFKVIVQLESGVVLEKTSGYITLAP